jgi:hypothetical protein
MVGRISAIAVASLLISCTSDQITNLPDGGALVLSDASSSRDSGPSPADARPTGDPCLDSDRDGDGFGTDPSCGQIDCDDRNPSIYPGGAEACNNLDDDCDGMRDEELGEGSCGRGACRRTAPFCVAGRPSACVPGTGSAETCNNVDDDCDGMTDEEIMGTTCGVGACARTAGCTMGMPEACVPGEPGTESCNRTDDDCDGTVDNGFRAEAVNSTYTELRMRHAGCDGSSQRLGSDCNAAMHRFCAQRGCTTSGFGPLENSGDTSFVGCVAAEPGRDVTYATLAQHHDVCDGTRERIGPNCNAAIHRYCNSQGFVSGFGPAEQGPSSALVICLRSGAATVVNTTYSVLVTHHGGCTQTSRIGSDCNAAINRFCVSQGFVTGYGPVENSGDVAVVTCVSR